MSASIDKTVVAKIKESLCGPYGYIKLRADGHELKAEWRRTSARSMTFGVALFVDGWIKGENLKTESEIGAKFYPLRTRCLIPAKELEKYRKSFGKRAMEDFKRRSTYQYREPSFRSAGALIAQLKKTCKQVEIIE